MNSKGQRGNCIYNRQWELNSKYEGWLTVFKADRKKALCKKGMIEISNMGESALKSHMKSERHKNNKKLSSMLEKLKEWFYTILSFWCATLFALTGIAFLAWLWKKCDIVPEETDSLNIVKSPWKVLEKSLNKRSSNLYEPCHVQFKLSFFFFLYVVVVVFNCGYLLLSRPFGSNSARFGNKRAMTNIVNCGSQSCPILTTCSSRESEDSTRASRTTGASGECETLDKNNKSIRYKWRNCIALRKATSLVKSHQSFKWVVQLVRVVWPVQVM